MEQFASVVGMVFWGAAVVAAVVVPVAAWFHINIRRGNL